MDGGAHLPRGFSAQEGIKAMWESAAAWWRRRKFKERLEVVCAGRMVNTAKWERRLHNRGPVCRSRGYLPRAGTQSIGSVGSPAGCAGSHAEAREHATR